MKAMVLAAGRGTRMGGLTADVPKPLLEVNGEALIERHLRRLAEAGFEQIVINLSYLGEHIRSRLGDGARFGVRIRYSEEGEPALETAGGIVRALPLLGEDPFLLINADVVTDLDFGRLARAALLAAERPSWRGTLVLVANPAHHPQGDFGMAPRPGGEAATGGHHLTADPPRLTYSGISVLAPALFADCRDGPRPLKPILDAALAEGRLDAVRHDGLWMDVGTPERLREATRLLKRS